ncbi:MAG: DUF559 domain-containing protein [Candidatus Paceibacterota bacterium]|jgi:very-short-patch-repair endonuclease
MKWVHNTTELKDRRKELRKNSTETEQKIWFELRGNKLGVKFKRQHSIGGYIVDFYCQKYRLIIELDGEIHNTKEAQEYDAVRDKYFKELDYKILRFQNREVENGEGRVLEKISGILN